jgi:hypothetical protein
VRHQLLQDEDLFHLWFDKWKTSRYAYTAAQCVRDALHSAARAPREWFTFYALIEEDSEECKGVILTIEDGRSCSAVNIASERSSGFGYGSFLFVEVIKYLCSMSYTSIDGGVSGRYGVYKDKIFLDVIPVDSSGSVPFIG